MLGAPGERLEEVALVHVQTVEELLTRAEAMAVAGAETLELPHVLQALSEHVAERALSPEEDEAYYKFCVRLAAEPSPRVASGHPAGSWRERLQAVHARHLRRQAAGVQRRSYLARSVLTGWRSAVRSTSPVWSASMAGTSPTVEGTGMVAQEISRISSPATSHGLWDKPGPRWSMTEAGDHMVQTPSTSHTTAALHSRTAAREEDSQHGEPPAPARGELALSPPRSDWDAALLCGCFRKWAVQTDESRQMRLDFSHAVAQFEEEAERWREYVLTRAVRLWRLSIHMQIAGAFAAETVYRYCWRRWTLLVRITLAELHREDVLLCSCLAAFRQVCVAIAHERHYRARATLMRLSLAAAQGQQKRLACAYWRQHGLDERWRRWAEFAKDSSRQRHANVLAEAQAVRWLPRRTSHWVDRWASYCREKAASRSRHAAAVAHYRRFALKCGVQNWFRYVQVRKHKLRRVAQVLIVLSTRILGTALSRWMMIAARGRKLRRAVIRFTHRVLLWSWAVWVERARQWKHAALIAALAGNHSRKTGVRSAFCVWHDNVVKFRLVDRKLKIAVARLLNLTLGSAFATWANSTKEVVDQRNKLERIIHMILNRVLHAAFRGWEASAMEKRVNREKMLRVVKMFQNVRLAAAFQGWFTRVYTKITNREKLLRLIKLLQSSRIISAFNAWRARTEFKVDSRHKIARAVTLMLNSLLHAAFAGWQARTNFKVVSRTKVARAVNLMLNSLLHAAFDGWHDKVSTNIENRALLTRVVAIMGNRTLSSAWAGWCRYVDVRTSNRSKVNRVVSRMHNSLIGKVFDRWARYTDAVFEAREQLHSAVLRCDKCACAARVVTAWHRTTRRLAKRRRKREHERVQYAVYHKVLTHARGAVKALAFNTWVAYGAAMVRSREIQARCIKFYMHRTLSSAFSTWVFAVSEMMHNRDKLEKFVSILVNRVLRSAFNGWKFNALEKSLNREKMMRVVKMFQSRAIASAFNSWYFTVQTTLDQKKVMAAAIAAASNRKTKSALLAWSHRTIERIEQRKVMFKAASIVANYRIAAAFKGWCVRCTEKMEQRDKADRAIRQLLYHAVARAFNTWVVNARQVVENRIKMVAVIRTFTRKGLAAAISRWNEFTLERAAMRDLLAQAICAMENFHIQSYFNLWTESLRGDQSLRYLLNRTLARAFVSWSDTVQEKIENTARIQRSLQMIANRGLASAMHSWGSAVSIAKCNREKLAAVLQHFHNRTLAAAMHGWTHVVNVARSNRERLAAVLQRFRGRAALRALVAWQDAVTIIQEHRKLLTQIVKRFQNRSLTAAFHCWQELAIDRASRTKQLQQAIEILGGSRRRSAFNGWIAAVQIRVENRTKLQAVHVRMLSRAMAGAFTTWACYATEKLTLHNKLSAVLIRISKLALAASFNAWCTIAQRSLQVNGFIYELTTKWRNGRSRQVFESWFIWAARRTELSALQNAITHDRQQKAKAGLMRGWSLLFVACCTYRLYMARSTVHKWASYARSARNARILSRAMAKLSMRTISLCFDGWKDVSCTYSRRKKIVHQVLSRINHRTLYASFDVWAEAAAEQAKFSRWVSLKAESFARRLLGDMLYSAFRTWRDWNLRRERTRLIGARIEERRAQIVKRQRMQTWQQRYIQSSTLTRIRMQGVQLVWRQWTELVQKAQQRRGQIKTAAQQWRICTTAGRFEHWQHTAVEARRIRAAARNLRTRQWWLRWRCHSKLAALDRLHGAVNSILLHRAGMAIGKWREFCLVRAQQRKTVAAAVKRMQQRELMAVFNTWHCTTRKQAGDNLTVAKAISRLRARLVVSIFAAWASLSARSAREKHILARAVNRLRLRAAEAAFRHWWAETEHSVALGGMLRVWVGRRVAAMLGHYISVWHDAMLVNAHRRWAADTIAVATCARLTARAWSAWAQVHRCELLQQTASARHARVVLHQWFSASQRCAEHRWRVQVVTERRVLRMIGLLLAAWRYHAIYARRSREVVMASHLRRHRAQAAYCLNIWRHFVAYTMELRRALHFWLGRKVAVVLTSSFRRWLEFCTNQAATELTWVRAVDFASARISAAFGRCFFALRRHALKKADGRQLRGIAENCCKRRQLKACFESWRGHLAELALAARQSSLVVGAIDSSLGDYLDASLHTSPMSVLQEKEPAAALAKSIGPPTELAGSLWQSESLTQLGKELEALASSFNMIGRPTMAPAAAQ